MRFVNFCMELMTFIASMLAGPPHPGPALAWHMNMISHENSRTPEGLDNMSCRQPHGTKQDKQNVAAPSQTKSQSTASVVESAWFKGWFEKGKQATNNRAMRKEGAHVITKNVKKA